LVQPSVEIGSAQIGERLHSRARKPLRPLAAALGLWEGGVTIDRDAPLPWGSLPLSSLQQALSDALTLVPSRGGWVQQLPARLVQLTLDQACEDGKSHAQVEQTSLTHKSHTRVSHESHTRVSHQSHTYPSLPHTPHSFPLPSPHIESLRNTRVSAEYCFFVHRHGRMTLIRRRRLWHGILTRVRGRRVVRRVIDMARSIWRSLWRARLASAPLAISAISA
jgi:hypothetical protein